MYGIAWVTLYVWVYCMFRAVVWKLLIISHRSESPRVFTLDEVDLNRVPEKTVKQIRVDLPRIFPRHMWLNCTAGHKSLERCLF